jgi:chemotaxis protein CheD
VRLRAESSSAHFLKPGEMLLSGEPIMVSTLLGSCVAVTMFSPSLRLGAICHALLPACRNDVPCSHRKEEAGKYVQCAIRRMLEGLMSRGVAKAEIQIKLFGGSDMFDVGEGRSRSVGRQNIEMALSMLETESLRLVKQDLGGRRGRKIVFNTRTGEVFLKRLKTTES